MNTLGEVMKKEQAATASAITAMGSDVGGVVTKVDVIEAEVSAGEKLLEKTNMRVEAIQERAKKIQQMVEDLA